MMENTLIYNVCELARKDPFDIATIEQIAKYDRVLYYSGIVGTFVQKLIEASDGCRTIQQRSYGIGSSARYFFFNNGKPDVEQWTSAESGGIFTGGDVKVRFYSRPDLETKVKKLFEFTKEFETDEWRLISEPEVLPTPVLCIDSDIIKFRYFAPKAGKRFFIFEFWHPEQQARIVKQMV